MTGADELMVQSLFGVRRINPSADLDERTLTAIAEQTGGRYFRAHDVAELAEIYTLLDQLEPAASEENGFRPVREYFHWPLGAALVLAFAWLAAALVRARFASPGALLTEPR